MKLYDALSPNTWRVQTFLAEKGMEVERVPVDLMAGETRKPPFLALNSLGQVPVLELDSGEILTESVAICRYFESLKPEPSLFGATAVEQARVEMWNRRAEQQIFDVVGRIGVHRIPYFAGVVEQIPAYADSLERQLTKNWLWLDREIGDGRSFLAGDNFTIADITAGAALFVAGFLGLAIPNEATAVHRWLATVRSRESWVEVKMPD